MSTIYKYRLYCNTDAKYEYIWSEDEPLKCPTNTSHIIDTSKTTIVESKGDNVVKILEESLETGGNYQCITLPVSAGPFSTGSNSKSWPYPVCVYAMRFISDATNVGDILCVCANPDTVIGVITSSLSPGATSMQVSSTVCTHLKLGYCLTITDGVNVDDLGATYSIDKTTSTIQFETPCVHAFSASTPTYVRMTNYILRDFIIGPPWQYEVGQCKIGGTSIPAGIVVRAIYKNNSDTTKSIIGQIEYTY